MDFSKEKEGGLAFVDICRSHLSPASTYADAFLAPVRRYEYYDKVTDYIGGRPAHALVASYLCSLVDQGIEVLAGGSNGPLELCTGIGLGIRVSRALPENVYAGTISPQLGELTDAFRALMVLQDLFPLGSDHEPAFTLPEEQSVWRVMTVGITLSNLLVKEFQEKITRRLVGLIGAQDLEIYIKGKPIEEIQQELLANLGIPPGGHTLLFPTSDLSQIGISCELGELAHGQPGIKVRVAEFMPSGTSAEPVLLRPFWRLCIQAFPQGETLAMDRSLGPGATNISRAALAKLVTDPTASRWVPTASAPIEWAKDHWGLSHPLVEANLHYIQNHSSLVVNLAFELVYQSALRSVWLKDKPGFVDFAHNFFCPQTLAKLLQENKPEIAQKILDNCASKLASAFSQKPVEALALILPQEVFDHLAPEVRDVMTGVLGLDTTLGLIKFITGDAAPDIDQLDALFLKLIHLREPVNPLSYGIDGFFQVLAAFGWSDFDSTSQSSVPLLRFFDTWQNALYGQTPTKDSLINAHLSEAVRQAAYFIRGTFTELVSQPAGASYALNSLSRLGLKLSEADLAKLRLTGHFNLAQALDDLIRIGFIKTGSLIPTWRSALDESTWTEVAQLFAQSPGQAVKEPVP